MPFTNPFMAARQRSILAPDTFMPGARKTSRPRLTMDFQLSDRRQPPQPMDEVPRPYDRYDEELNDIYNSAGPGLQAYKEALATQPNRDDYKPGIWKRLGTALAGGAVTYGGGDGYGMAKQVQEEPFQKAMTDYATKLGGLRERAGMEQDEAETRIRALQQARAMGLKYDEFELKRLEAQNRMTNATTTANAAMKRAEAYAAAQARPGYDAHAQEDGSVLYVNKNNPAEKITVPAKTVAAGQLGVARRNASTAERNATTNAGQLDVARTRAATDAARGAAYVENAGRNRNRPATPDAQRDAVDNALSEMMSDPVFKEFIQLDDKGFPSPIEDDGSEDYQDFLEALNERADQILKGNVRRPTRRQAAAAGGG